MGRAIDQLRQNLNHERDRRYALTDSLMKHRKDRAADCAKDRVNYALKQLHVERDVRYLVEELEIARREISDIRGEVYSLRALTYR